MGYQSKVLMIITGTKDDVLDAWVKFRLKHPWVSTYNGMDPLLKNMSITVNTEGTHAWAVFKADDWKWYSGYEDVDRVEDFWGWAEECSVSSESILQGCFIRIGENEDDIESRHFNDGYELAYVSCNIESDYSFEPENDIRSKL